MLNEDVSPAEANVWTMICGAQCFVFDDGETVPQMDFVLPVDAIEASCEACRRGGERTTVAVEEKSDV